MAPFAKPKRLNVVSAVRLSPWTQNKHNNKKPIRESGAVVSACPWNDGALHCQEEEIQRNLTGAGGAGLKHYNKTRKVYGTTTTKQQQQHRMYLYAFLITNTIDWKFAFPLYLYGEVISSETFDYTVAHVN